MGIAKWSVRVPATGMMPFRYAGQPGLSPLFVFSRNGTHHDLDQYHRDGFVNFIDKAFKTLDIGRWAADQETVELKIHLDVEFRFDLIGNNVDQGLRGILIVSETVGTTGADIAGVTKVVLSTVQALVLTIAKIVDAARTGTPGRSIASRIGGRVAQQLHRAVHHLNDLDFPHAELVGGTEEIDIVLFFKSEGCRVGGVSGIDRIDLITVPGAAIGNGLFLHGRSP